MTRLLAESIAKEFPPGVGALGQRCAERSTIAGSACSTGTLGAGGGDQIP